MIKFDSRGFLKPYQPIRCSLEEFKYHFVDCFTSETRLSNYKNYIRYSDHLKDLLGGTELFQWVNGSFVTKKTNPNDIDLITFVSHDLIKKTGNKLASFTPEKCWEEFGVDAYIIEVLPESNKLYHYTLSDKMYWLNLFGHTRINRKGIKNAKGFLEIIY